MTDEDLRQPLLHHMKDLAKALRLGVLFLMAGGALGYVYSELLLSLVTEPYDRVFGDSQPLVFISPFEKVWVHLRLAFWGGLLAVLPFLYLSFYPFFRPALLKKERALINFAVLLFLGTFYLGLFIGQNFVVELLLQALLSFKDGGEGAFLSLEPFVGMSVGVMLATALLLEIPLVMFFLSRLGWVDPKHWAAGRRIAVVVNAILAAFLSPPDVMSMLVLMLPIQVLYECGILLSRMAKWGQNEKLEVSTEN